MLNYYFGFLLVPYSLLTLEREDKCASKAAFLSVSLFHHSRIGDQSSNNGRGFRSET